MNYSIIMPYIDRDILLNNTLISFLHHYGKRDDYEVIIVEDYKNHTNKKLKALVSKVIKKFKQHIFIQHWGSLCKDCYNPAPLFNLGAKHAKGNFLVITNPECFHKDNILAGFDEEFDKNKDAYVIPACQEIKGYPKNITTFKGMCNYKMSRWYQHSTKRNMCLHWCNALSKENYFKIGGFDNRYAHGIGFEDNEFKSRVIKSLPFVCRDDLMVLHQAHPPVMKGREWSDLVVKNKGIGR